MTIYETELPGVGRKFDLELESGGLASVVVHHDGRCELYRRPDREQDSEKFLDLTSEEATKLGSLLEGVYFESVDVDELAVPLGDAIIEWVEIPEESAFVGETLVGSELKQGVGTTIIAVQRGTETVANPAAEFELAAGDLLVAIGDREEQATLKKLITESP